MPNKPVTTFNRQKNQILPTELERETGIEPASLAWKARVLPLNYSRTNRTSSNLDSRRPA